VLKALKENPVRVYALVVAALALASRYLPALPVEDILGLVSAGIALVGGEIVRAKVVPETKITTVHTHEEAYDLLTDGIDTPWRVDFDDVEGDGG
jgi:hypothetical protein